MINGGTPKNAVHESCGLDRLSAYVIPTKWMTEEFFGVSFALTDFLRFFLAVVFLELFGKKMKEGGCDEGCVLFQCNGTSASCDENA